MNVKIYNKLEICTSQLCKLRHSISLQYVDRQMTASSFICLHPLALNRFNLPQPRANASTPLCDIKWHHDTLISVKFYNYGTNINAKHYIIEKFLNTEHPSEIALRLLSVMCTHDSRFIDVNFGQCLLIEFIDESVIFLQSDKSSRSTLWQYWANVLRAHNKNISII